MRPELASLVSPFTGVVRGVDEVLADPADIRLASVVCETGWAGALVGLSEKHLGAGSGRTRELARTAAVAEAVERYSASYAGEAGGVLASAAELGPRAVAPGRFALFSARQHAQRGFAYAPFRDATRVAWVEGVSLPGLEPALLPAQLVYLGWATRPGEERIGTSTSSGLSCRPTFEEAALTGLLEAVERDAFMIVWRARLTLPRLAWRASARLRAFEARYLRPTGLAVAAIDLSRVWDVPCVLGVARSRVAGEAPLGVGAAAAPDIEAAVEKALDEAVRVRTWARALRADDPDGAPLRSADEIREFEQHIRWYAYDEHARAAAFLDASGERRDVRDVLPLEGATARDRLDALCGRLARRGASAYAVDVTAPDVRAAGLRVVKVVAPELCPLDVEHGARMLGGRRLRTEPFRLGLAPRVLREDELNPEPHPFP